MAAKKKSKKSSNQAKKPAAKSPAKAKTKTKTKAKPVKAKVKAKAKAKSPAKVKAKAKAKPPTNAMVHWEIQSKQPEVLHRFYSEVFGWKIDANNPMNYGMVASKGATGIDGGIGPSQDHGPRVVVYASVKSINPTLERIEALGGRTILPRSEAGPVILALYLDPEGNTMGLVEDR